MKNMKKSMLLSFFLVAGLCWLFMGRHLKAAEGAPVLEYLYRAEDGEGGQILIASVRGMGEGMERASLSWKSEEGVQTIEALEVLDGYAAFLTEGTVIPEEQMCALAVTCGGKEYTLDLQEFRGAEDTVKASVEGELEEELPVAEDTEKIGEAIREAEEASGRSGREREISEITPGNGLNRTNGDIVIVLDPGHGGSDSGAYRTWDGVRYIEKEITLKIAEYTKEELETYEGVRVYLTRSTDIYLTLEERVDYAANVGATVLVSQHINSTPENETTATGAEVMVSKGNYRPAQAEETAEIARTILAELETVGFSNRDLVYKLSETGNTYPNGKLADYYGIVRRSVLAGFPGMIVEHGFVSNPKDCLKYYSTNARIRRLGVADATALAGYYGLKKRGFIGWNQEDGRWFYVDAEGERMPAGWLELNGLRYYLDADGYRVTGWQTIGGNKYYFDSEGVMKAGAASIDGKLYYFGPKGVMIRTLKKGSDGKYYYARKNGVLRTGWQTIGGKKYYFAQKTGAARTGWAKIGRYYYFFKKNGCMRKGLITLEGKKYYLDQNGRRLSGFVTYKKKKYYFSTETGEMQRRIWVQYGEKWYYIGKNGYALQSTRRTIDGVRYRFDKNGVCTNR